VGENKVSKKGKAGAKTAEEAAKAAKAAKKLKKLGKGLVGRKRLIAKATVNRLKDLPARFFNVL
jgi:hypothetical protein